MGMRIAILWAALVMGAAVLVAMLVAMRRHRARAASLAQAIAAAEYLWVVVPWLIVALCVTPAVHRILAAGLR
jgi:heme/copper-type cytochrome/quinol oxidase subunit 2